MKYSSPCSWKMRVFGGSGGKWVGCGAGGCDQQSRERAGGRKEHTSRPKLTSPSISTSHSSSRRHSLPSSPGSALPLPFPSTTFSPPLVQTFTTNRLCRMPSQRGSASSSSSVGVGGRGESYASEARVEASTFGGGSRKPSRSTTNVGCIVSVAVEETKNGGGAGGGSIEPGEKPTGEESVRLL